MQEERTEGIVLRSQDYQERHRIITLFTPQGLISCIVRNISRKNVRLLSLTTPFCHAEYHYKKSRSDLVQFVDGAVLNDHLDLRQSLGMLNTAGALASALLTSQMADKPAPALFALYKSYHRQVASFSHSEPLLASFYLKLLKHEGLLMLSPQCLSCEKTADRIHEGASFCADHALNGIEFRQNEWDLLLTLDNALQFSVLQELTLSPDFYKKVYTIFLSRISH